ncbi:uncharacterized protein LOC126973239 [Leptidea sinapis]|uniref:uncharacterized protein LOC126973239 n=1 Tax=Leptidea sinapis TaxID=189913 RepID=UPI002139CC3F|nr:uncharacterized protein LOC126973239 [Leptidea sinapis]XP_050676393.1 uncharacterized protein LOC126973239 [Leptidea sinapis]
MVEQCCVDGCLNSTDDVSYFKLPVSRTQRRKWLDAINSGFKLTDDAMVCSKHFEPDNYILVRGRRRLKPKVVPSLFEKKRCLPDDAKDKTVGVEQHDVPIEFASEIAEKQDDVAKDVGERLREEAEVEGTGRELENSDVADKPSEEELTNKKEKQQTAGDNTNDTSEDERKPLIEGENAEVERREEEKAKKLENKPNHIDEDVVEVQQSPTKLLPVLDSMYKDLEEVIKNYQIKQTRPLSELLRERDEDMRMAHDRAERADATSFVEVEIKEGRGQGSGDRDCLMLLENVQVEIDPANLLLCDRDSDVEQVGLDSTSDVIHLGKRKENPISLLTSSDDDDVIIEEPHIDTVVVSDATDEDDLPLLKLVKRKKKQSQKSAAIAKIMTYCQYECIKCHYCTNSLADYKSHITTHFQIVMYCQTCNFATPSEAVMGAHKSKHHLDKKGVKLVQKYKCPLCEYRARHHMSLVYHLETHKNEGTCSASANANECKMCPYCNHYSSRKRDLKRHLRAQHADERDIDKVLLEI